MADVQRLNQVVEEAQSLLNDLAEEYSAGRLELEQLNGGIEERQKSLGLLEKGYSETRKRLENERAALLEALTTSKQELGDVKTRLDKAHQELTAVQRKHKEFMDYKVRAEKVLAARETAILDREREIDRIATEAKRRTSILGSVS